ncbi:TIGR04197 family type VII secretion effector [Streptococcus ferus]|uniref:TIGR04197 family type VII secretion effector n=1 Tax=Streptococcus ferus TaxID=1345 RepID=UPI0023566156|nr:TIGR04197 family type VII secretion effector [Streptococcus ferus]
MTIQSSLSDAQVYATNIKQGSGTLGGVTQAQEDSLTTVSGNANAHEAMGADQTARQQISAALADMVTNINSVASEFEAVDQQVAESMGK